MLSAPRQLFPNAFLFEEDGTPFKAVTIDDVGEKLPDSTSGWRFVARLDTRAGLPDGLALSTVGRRLASDGVYIWRSSVSP
jgi:hypothetical protein